MFLIVICGCDVIDFIIDKLSEWHEKFFDFKKQRNWMLKELKNGL